MGYSCAQDANNSLAVICHLFATDGNPNILTIRGKQYFFERGREQEDGSITGKLMVMLPNDFCQVAGTVKIAANGDIIRFPRLSRHDKEEAANSFRDLQARNPALLRKWGMGVI